jgi:hypothetical protein
LIGGSGEIQAARRLKDAASGHAEANLDLVSGKDRTGQDLESADATIRVQEAAEWTAAIEGFKSATRKALRIS